MHPRLLELFRATTVAGTDLTMQQTVALLPLGQQSLGHVVRDMVLRELSKKEKVTFTGRKLAFQAQITSKNAVVFDATQPNQREYFSLTSEKGIDGIWYEVNSDGDTILIKSVVQIKYTLLTGIKLTNAKTIQKAVIRDLKSLIAGFIEHKLLVEIDSTVRYLLFSPIADEATECLKQSIKFHSKSANRDYEVKCECILGTKFLQFLPTSAVLLIESSHESCFEFIRV